MLVIWYQVLVFPSSLPLSWHPSVLGPVPLNTLRILLIKMAADWAPVRPLLNPHPSTDWSSCLSGIAPPHVLAPTWTHLPGVALFRTPRLAGPPLGPTSPSWMSVVTKEMCSCPCVSSRPGQSWRSTYPRKKCHWSNLFQSRATWTGWQGCLSVDAGRSRCFPSSVWYLVEAPAEDGIHCDGKGGPGGFVGQLRPLGGDHKGFVVGSSVNLDFKIAKIRLG